MITSCKSHIYLPVSFSECLQLFFPLQQILPTDYDSWNTLLTLISVFIKYLVILTGNMLVLRFLVKCGKGNIPHHNCFSSLIDVKDSSSCLLWVHTSKWFHYVNNVKEEAVIHDDGPVNLAHAYSFQSLITFCICKSANE